MTRTLLDQNYTREYKQSTNEAVCIRWRLPPRASGQESMKTRGKAMAAPTVAQQILADTGSFSGRLLAENPSDLAVEITVPTIAAVRG